MCCIRERYNYVRKQIYEDCSWRPVCSVQFIRKRKRGSTALSLKSWTGTVHLWCKVVFPPMHQTGATKCDGEVASLQYCTSTIGLIAVCDIKIIRGNEIIQLCPHSFLFPLRFKIVMNGFYTLGGIKCMNEADHCTSAFPQLTWIHFTFKTTCVIVS